MTDAAELAYWDALWRRAEECVRAEEHAMGGDFVDDHYRLMAEFAASRPALATELERVTAEKVRSFPSLTEHDIFPYEAIALVAHTTRWPAVLDAARAMRPAVPANMRHAFDWIIEAYRDDWRGKRMY